eukprot:361382-Chlamydomonas_euryale.AAC.6
MVCDPRHGVPPKDTAWCATQGHGIHARDRRSTRRAQASWAGFAAQIEVAAAAGTATPRQGGVSTGESAP